MLFDDPGQQGSIVPQDLLFITMYRRDNDKVGVIYLLYQGIRANGKKTILHTGLPPWSHQLDSEERRFPGLHEIVIHLQ
jgi:hypothetical protein